MELYHGSHCNETLVIHLGLCLTDSQRSAEAYGQHLHTVEIDMSSLRVEDVEGYDRDDNEAPGDRDISEWADSGIDVICYDDEDEFGRQHACWRLVSNKACAAVRAR
jgi:hypothetical protein